MFEDYSTLEEFRIAYHGKSKLRFLSRKADSKKYLLIKQVLKAFYIGRKDDAEESKHQEFLTLELTRAGLSKDEFLRAIALDLVYENGTFKRYSFGGERQGSFEGSWIVTVLNANFNDKQEIDGVEIVIPSADPVQEFLFRYIHQQTVPAMVWTVNHNLSEKVLAEVVDDDGEIMFSASIIHTSLNQLVISFDVPITGEVRIL